MRIEPLKRYLSKENTKSGVEPDKYKINRRIEKETIVKQWEELSRSDTVEGDAIGHRNLAGRGYLLIESGAVDSAYLWAHSRSLRDALHHHKLA